MKRFVYILTDCNRQYLHVGLTDDLFKTMTFYKEHRQLFFDTAAKVSRLVYFEEIDTEELGIARFNVLSAFTRSQKERLIRAKNKDWQDLSLCLGIDNLVANPQQPLRFSSMRAW
ncbi:MULTISPECIES: GIY-YIG nuclease family protein [Olivibacter]|jgi:putative endonuclease|uniref:GIY-YIG nuclease family protein n=2 Tax=Olivibacter TaxID=376469 RepID=A0ABW6AXM3_9SPHI|nr:MULTISPECIES: GIY-YIG nuclease family protein [Olivibacter]MDM8174973.1 GIY-YIG nuclease family protein [Olivibacter sp. 47]MDX3913345.1 GIY-YIG nuclease family protein [Pseudosphingobacterium sp.]QEL01754.1 GIY-YIG nuclease family protein [Olivibacter sp. LS-1]